MGLKMGYIMGRHSQRVIMCQVSLVLLITMETLNYKPLGNVCRCTSMSGMSVLCKGFGYLTTYKAKDEPGSGTCLP